MMVSPENVYEELKGKSDKEVLLQLRRFKQLIVQLKKDLEFPNAEEVVVVCPSPLVQIKCIRNYIEECKRILAERGIEYKPTRIEQRALDFNSRLTELTQIQVIFTGLFAGYKNYIVTLGESEQSVSYGVGIDFTQIHSWKIELDKLEFISELAELNIGEWKHSYHSPALDGIQWEMKFTFADGTRQKFEGSNAYPYNFDVLVELLSIDGELE